MTKKQKEKEIRKFCEKYSRQIVKLERELEETKAFYSFWHRKYRKIVLEEKK